ncbi:MAG: GyrI-like domain-containing protein [Methylocystaceae bacterium]
MSNDMIKQVELVDIPETLVRSERKVLTDFPVGLGPMMNGGFAAIQSAGELPSGPPILVYYDEVYTPEKVDVECAWPVADSKLATNTLPAITAARYTYTGSYDGLEKVYPVIMQWISENGFRPLVPMREVYVNDPAVTPSEELITEVIIPIAKV